MCKPLIDQLFPISATSGGLTICGNHDVLLRVVQDIREIYDSNGTDMPKALGDVIFSLEDQLNIIEKGV